MFGIGSVSVASASFGWVYLECGSSDLLWKLVEEKSSRLDRQVPSESFLAII